MKRVILKELNFETRNEALAFLKKLWKQQKAECPICGNELDICLMKSTNIFQIDKLQK